ncbi:MAG: hypothetical protein RBR53_03540 [Desulforegulaceae bacterium]|nr:hypothetical protein [Desulforegulaceae bacterium]
MNKQEIGSMTAKGGFLNEKYICEKFLNWKKDINAQQWLKVMGYNYEKIDSLNAIHIPVRISLRTALSLGITKEKYEETIRFKKADIQIRLEIKIKETLFLENISLKKANKGAGFNQVDKRPVETYQGMWKFNEKISRWLKLFTGEINPKKYMEKINCLKLRDERRLFFSEIPENIKEELLKFFKDNKTIIICDILKGRGGLSADWFLVTEKDGEKISWIMKDINYVLNHYSQGEIELSPRGSLKIGRVLMQRKGGTPDPESLQFKINPLSLFEG